LLKLALKSRSSHPPGERLVLNGVAGQIADFLGNVVREGAAPDSATTSVATSTCALIAAALGVVT